VESTQTQAPVAAGHQERQLIAGRYRLASFHRGDGSTEVWRALDESAHQVVSLEFFRDPDPAAKERFLTAARRMASVEQPSVMRVAAVHDDANGTFIVFEHLVHIPIPPEWLKVDVEPPAPILDASVQSAISSPNVAAAPTPPPILTLAAEGEVATPSLTNETSGDRGLSLLTFALRSRELSLIDVPLLKESAVEFLAVVRSSFEDIHVDPEFITDIRGLPGRVNMSLLTSALAGAAGAAGRLATVRPHVRVPSPRVPRPVSAPRVKAVAPPKPAKAPRAQAAPRAARAPRRVVLHVRWGRVLTRGLSLGVLAAAVIVVPQELVTNVATELSATLSQKLGALMQPSAPQLARASFEVPPLSAYRAAFEAQAPYPTARPNGTVEWVVALRNTGSVGWYRGIDGAQASLVLADGTSAGVQTTAYVGPGQVGWFVVHFAAPSQTGVSRIALLPRIDGRGLLPDLGIYAAVTVSPNP
jgi:hypothetical protein